MQSLQGCRSGCGAEVLRALGVPPTPPQTFWRKFAVLMGMQAWFCLNNIILFKLRLRILMALGLRTLQFVGGAALRYWCSRSHPYVTGAHCKRLLVVRGVGVSARGPSRFHRFRLLAHAWNPIQIHCAPMRELICKAGAEPEMLYPAVVVSHPCDRRKSQGWGTEVWGTAILEQL